MTSEEAFNPQEGHKVAPVNVEDEMKNCFIDYAMSVIASAEEIHQAVIHFNNAKNAQKNAEKLFKGL